MNVLLQMLLTGLGVVALIALIAGGFTLAGWHHIRESWNKPVTFRDYLTFRHAVLHNDNEGIFRIVHKYGYLFGLLLALIAVPAVAQHDPFNDPKYTGIQPEAPCPAGFDCAGLAQSVHVAQRLEMVAGHAQIGHVPGRIDVLRPTVKELSLGQNVHFVLTVLWRGAADHPCSGAAGCVASVGIRHRPDGFTDTWTTFTFRSEPGDRQLTLDLPSKAHDNVLPCGHHDVFVRVRNDQDTLLERLVPVAIHADRCPGR